MPELDADLSHVDTPRTLAVRAVPAEAMPGETVTLTALVADAAGTVDDARLAWSLCAARRPLAEPGPIHRDCLMDDDVRAPLGEGITVDAKIPDDVCRRFGPDPPLSDADGPAGRPVDPDLTGGYYQPVLVTAPDGATTLYQARVRCGVAGATQAQAAEFRQRYRPNTGPEIVALAADGVDVGDEWSVRPGQRVELAVRWPACTDEAGCPGAETYLRFDPVDLELTTTREAMRVRWYATAGEFAVGSTGRAATDAEVDSSNTWTAPAGAGPVNLWVVLRDDRGGTGWATFALAVEDPRP